jgi:hypothetical protein
MPKLIVLEGQMKGQSFKFKGESFVLGRSSTNDIKVVDMGVSRKHCHIFKVGGKFYIEDLKSTNGTRVNGYKLRTGERYEVGENDFIAIGKTVFCLIDFPAVNPMEREQIYAGSGTKGAAKKPTKPDGTEAPSKRQLDLINKASHLIKRSFDEHEFLEKILGYLMDSIPGIDSASIILLDYTKTGKVKVRKTFSRSREGAEHRQGTISPEVLGQAIKQAKIVKRIDSATEKAYESIGDKGTVKMGTVICVPIISQSVVKAAIYVDSLDSTYGFRKKDISILDHVSGLLSAAVEGQMLSP